VWRPVCDEFDPDNIRRGEGTIIRSESLSLMRVDTAGTVSTTPLASWSDTTPDTYAGEGNYVHIDGVQIAFEIPAASLQRGSAAARKTAVETIRSTSNVTK
jgi:hypothetical protein